MRLIYASNISLIFYRIFIAIFIYAYTYNTFIIIIFVIKFNEIFYYFILGTNPKNFSIQKESKEYNDIIQIDKIDFYYHNSCKFFFIEINYI